MKSTQPLNLKIVSVGGRGANILGRLDSLEKEGIERLAISVPNRIFSALAVKTKIELNTDTGPDANHQANEAAKQALSSADAVCFVGNLANTTTHIQVAKLADFARQKGILTFFVGAMPFAFEGAFAQTLARQNKLYLEQQVDAVIVLDSNRIAAETTTAVAAFTQIDTIIGQVVAAILNVVNKFGAINVDFADLKTILQNAGEVFFNAQIGSRHNLEELTAALFAQHQQLVSKSHYHNVLYVIYAGKDVLMSEIQQLGVSIQNHVTDQARVIFGIVTDEQNDANVRVVLLGA